MHFTNKDKIALVQDMKQVIIYLMPQCPFCLKTKELLQRNEVPFQEIDVKKDEFAWKEMVRKSGQMGVPVIFINGDIVVGYDEPKLRGMLKLAK